MKPVKSNATAFDIPSVTRPEGYLLIDHSNSPGLPEEFSRKMGFDPALTREGKRYEAKSYRCEHCPAVVIMRHDRTRARAFCSSCGGYVCDACVAASKMPGYEHMTRQQKLDLATSGKWELSGSWSLPTFTRKDTSNG